ncbi:MAG: hypothetical protein ACYCXW_15775 [Solirubrobacteraceae bacterium]
MPVKAKLSAIASRATVASAPISQRERDAGVTHDEASYSCECGFVFQAPVSTSVGCPHCGATQAW